MLARIWRKGTPFALLVGMQTGATTVESNMEIPQKIKNGTALRLSNSTSGNLSEKTWNTNLKDYKHRYFHCSFIYNRQDLEVAQVSINRWVNKTTMGYLHNGILLGCRKKKKILPFATARMDLENIMLSEIRHSGKSNTIWFHSYIESNEQTELKRKMGTVL